MCGKTSLLPGKLLLRTCTYLDNADNWIWTSSSNGAFSLTSAWNIVSVLVPNLNWLMLYGSLDTYLRCLVVPSEPSMIGLPMTARLKQFHIVQTDTCVLCNKETETISHLYFSCSYANSKCGWTHLQELWKMKLLISSWNSRRTTNVTSYLGWHCAEQYGTYGMRGIEEYSNIRACVRYNYLEDCMKTSISYWEHATGKNQMIHQTEQCWATGAESYADANR